MVKEKFSDVENFIEIKIFPGLKITSKCIPLEQTVAKRLNINQDYSVFMSAVFTDYFRKQVKTSIKNKI